jgi:hypothetical protein
MDIVASQHPDAFRAYAIRDAEIAVDWLLKVAEFAKAWGLEQMPRTVASMGVARLRRDAEGELPAIVGRGVKPSGALGDYLPEALAVQGIAADAYHGGRNEGFVHGIFTGTRERPFTDFDLKGAYTNALAQFRAIDWAAIEHTTDLERLAVLEPLTVACVDFEFPPGTRFPSLPVDAAGYGLIYPLKGTTTVPGPELVVALSQGAHILVRAGVVAPWLDPNAGRPFVDYARLVNRTRAGYLKGSPLELLAKEAGNSLYGKTGQGVGGMKTAPANRRVFDSRSGESHPLPPSPITCPIVAAHTSGLPRAVVSEILGRLPPHVRVLSATTDGWLSDVTEEEARAAASGQVGRHFAGLRVLVDPAGSDEILEVKHRALTVLVAKTRHGVTITPVPGSKLICARAGHRLPEDAPSPEAETAEWVRIQRERTYLTNLPRRQFISPRDQWHRDGDLVDYYREVRVNLDYDMKRAPVAPRDVDGLINFTTEPWIDVDAFRAARSDLDRWQSATRSVLKTTDDWIRLQHWRGMPRTRSAGRRTPLQQAILVAWAKGLPGFPIRRSRGRGGIGPTLADIARILTRAGVPEVTRKVLQNARANEADPTGTVTTLAECDLVTLAYLADHLPPEAIQSVLAEGLKKPPARGHSIGARRRLKKPPAANLSELVHMGNAPTISPPPHPTEITDENTYSDDVQIQMLQTGWGGREFGAFATPLLESPRDAAPAPAPEPADPAPNLADGAAVPGLQPCPPARAARQPTTLGPAARRPRHCGPAPGPRHRRRHPRVAQPGPDRPATHRSEDRLMPIHPSITPSAPHSPIAAVQPRAASHDDPRNRLYNASSFQRAPADFYPTPPDLTRGLIDGLGEVAIALPGPVLEPCCGAGALATVLAAESGLEVVGSDLYPERYTEAAALYATTAPVDARDAAALLRVIEMTGAAALVTNPPYGRDHHRIAEAFLRLLRGGCIRFAALLVPHQFDAAGQRRHLFQDPLCALRIVMPWRPEWIEGTKGGGTISSTWWVWTADRRPSASPGTVWVKRRPCERIARHRVGQEEAVCEHPNRQATTAERARVRWGKW